MILPIRDIYSTEAQKAFRFGHHGMIVNLKGHEELFFEFSNEERRKMCIRLLEQRIVDVRKHVDSGVAHVPSAGEREALVLEELDSSGLSESDHAKPPPENEAAIPAVMFTSASSTFLNFKPSRPLRFTCLTIGTRGDVQPYIALCKGLQADGHHVRIATHVEYKDWVEGVSSSR
jgi:hypothetical protein